MRDFTKEVIAAPEGLPKHLHQHETTPRAARSGADHELHWIDLRRCMQELLSQCLMNAHDPKYGLVRGRAPALRSSLTTS